MKNPWARGGLQVLAWRGGAPIAGSVTRSREHLREFCPAARLLRCRAPPLERLRPLALCLPETRLPT